MSSVMQPPLQDRRLGERRRYPNQAATFSTSAFRVSWPGVWSGVLAVIGILLLLTALGLAIGTVTVDNADAATLGTGAGIWAAASLLIALFFGGMMATRLGMITDRSTGAYEGMLVWVLSVLLILYLAASGIGLLASGAFNMVSGAGRAVSAAAGSGDLSEGNIDQMVARLRDPQTAQQIAAATGMSPSEVSSQLDQTAQAVQNARDNPAQAASEMRRRMSELMARAPTDRIQRAAGMSAWATFFALLLSLGAAIGGAMMGRRNAAHHAEKATVAQRTTT